MAEDSGTAAPMTEGRLAAFRRWSKNAGRLDRRAPIIAELVAEIDRLRAQAAHSIDLHVHVIDVDCELIIEDEPASEHTP